MLLHRGLNGTSDGNTRDRDEIVSTSVSDAGKGIHLRVDPQCATAGSVRECRLPCCGQQIVLRDGPPRLLLHVGGLDVVRAAGQAS